MKHAIRARHERLSLVKLFILLLLLGAVVIFPSFGTRDPWGPDEARYMEVAREMYLMRDYVIPHLNGEVYSEKPPLFFWLAGGLHQAGFGWNSGRLLAGLSILGTLALIYSFAPRFLSPRASFLAGLVSLTAMLFLVTSKMGVLDPLVTLLVTGALSCALRALTRQSAGQRLWWLPFYACMGLACLTKGPVGILVPAAVVIPYALIVRKRFWRTGPNGETRESSQIIEEGKRAESGRGCWMHLAGAALLVTIVGAWLVPAIFQGGREYAETILIKQSAGRAVGSYSHRNPFYHYIATFPGTFFPWSLLFPLVAVWAWRAWRREGNRATLFFLAWFTVVLVLFSMISGKRLGYILPIFPPFACLCGWALDRFLLTRHSPSRALQLLITAALWCSAAIIILTAVSLPLAPWIIEHLLPQYLDVKADLQATIHGAGLFIAVAWLGLLAAAAIWGARASLRYASGAPLAILFGIVLGTSLFADLAVTPTMNRFKSARPLVESIRPQLGQADEVYLARRDYSGLYNLFSGRLSMPVLNDEAVKKEDKESAAVAWLAEVLGLEDREGEKYVNAAARKGSDRFAAALGSSRRVMIIGERDIITKWCDETFLAVTPIAIRRVGNREIWVVTNFPEPVRHRPAPASPPGSPQPAGPH